MDLTQEQREQALNLAAQGHTFGNIAKILGFRDDMSFVRYRRKYPLFDEELKSARAHSVDEEISNLNAMVDAEVDPQRARVKSDNSKWRASKLISEVYGDKLRVDVTQTLDITAALEASNRRIERLVQPLDTPDDGDLW